MKRWVASCIALAVLGAPSLAEPPVAATVQTVSGRSVYLNVGRKDGVVAGARVVFRLINGVQIEATIVDVSANNSRAELPEGSLLPEINDHAEVQISAPMREEVADPAKSKPPPPVHAPWLRKDGERTADTPLLAPAFSTNPAERPMTVRGRVFTTTRYTRDLANNANYTYARIGTWLEVQNPFKNEDRFRFEGDTDYRAISTSLRSDSKLHGRIQRMSYAWGTNQDAPFRGEVGRFYSQSLPEIGIIDGGEAAVRLENGLSFGGGAGLYPTLYKKLTSTKDLGFHAFVDYQSEKEDSWFQGTFGVQQTWHTGAADRTLVIGRVNARPSRDLTIFGSVMVDLYGSGDTVKTQSAEITQLVSQVSYQINETNGLTGSITRMTWPELKREEYASLPPELIHNGYVDRISGSWWHKFSKSFRVTAQSHYWRDQDRKGYGGELSADSYLSDAANSSIFGSVYYEDSAYTKGVGARLQGQRDLGSVRLFLGYDVYNYSSSTFLGGTSDYLRQSVRTDVSWSTGRWSWDIETSYTFGDSEESLSFGVNMQYRF